MVFNIYRNEVLVVFFLFYLINYKVVVFLGLEIKMFFFSSISKLDY